MTKFASWRKEFPIWKARLPFWKQRWQTWRKDFWLWSRNQVWKTTLNLRTSQWLHLNYAWVEYFSPVSEFPPPKEPAIFPNEPQPHTRHPVHSQQQTTVYVAKDPGTPPQNPVPQYGPDKIVIPISSLYPGGASSVSIPSSSQHGEVDRQETKGELYNRWSRYLSLLVILSCGHIKTIVFPLFRVYQEPITRSLQLPHIPVTAFSQNDLLLVWIYLEFWSPRELHWPIANTSTD